MVFRSSRSFKNPTRSTPVQTRTVPTQAPSPEGRRRRRVEQDESETAEVSRPVTPADPNAIVRVSERRRRDSVRSEPTRVTLTVDGEIGRVGSKWWEKRGTRLYRLAKGRNPEDPVLATAKLAARQFTGWDEETLPAGAQRVYDTIAGLVADLEGGAVEPESQPKRPSRRGRRGSRSEESVVASETMTEGAEEPEGEEVQEVAEEPGEASEEAFETEDEVDATVEVLASDEPEGEASESADPAENSDDGETGETDPE